MRIEDGPEIAIIQIGKQRPMTANNRKA